MFCQHKDRGCKWGGGLGELDKHLRNSCEFAVMTCPLCHEYLERVNFYPHKAKLRRQPNEGFKFVVIVPFIVVVILILLAVCQIQAQVDQERTGSSILQLPANISMMYQYENMSFYWTSPLFSLTNNGIMFYLNIYEDFSHSLYVQFCATRFPSVTSC